MEEHPKNMCYVILSITAVSWTVFISVIIDHTCLRLDISTIESKIAYTIMVMDLVRGCLKRASNLIFPDRVNDT